MTAAPFTISELEIIELTVMSSMPRGQVMVKQLRGCFPLFTILPGGCCMAYFGLAIILNVRERLGSAFTDEYETMIIRLFGTIAFYGIAFLPFILAGVAVSQIVPFHRITDKGLRYWTPVSIIPRLIEWGEIREVINVPLLTAVVISRRGGNLIDSRGLGINYLFGLFVGKLAPVIFISASNSEADFIRSKIQSNDARKE